MLPPARSTSRGSVFTGDSSLPSLRSNFEESFPDRSSFLNRKEPTLGLEKVLNRGSNACAVA